MLIFQAQLHLKVTAWEYCLNSRVELVAPWDDRDLMIFFGIPLGTKPAGIQKTLTSWVGCMEGWGMDRRLGGCMDRWMGRWTDGWVGAWTDGWVDGQMAGWVNGGSDT